MYPKWLSVLMCYFDLWGFCSQFRTTPNQQTIYKIIFMCHLALDLYVTVVIVEFLKRPIGDSLGVLIDSMKLCPHTLMNWISVCELYFKHRTQNKFWNVIQNINEQFFSHDNLCFKAYLIEMIIYFIVLILMFLNYLIYVRRSELISFWIASIFIISFFKHYFFYYLFYSEFIKYELTQVERKSFEICTNVHLKLSHSNQFQKIRRLYESVNELFNVVNEVFRWSNAVGVPISFLLMLVDINWFYWKIFNKYQVDFLGKHLFFKCQSKLTKSKSKSK